MNSPPPLKTDPKFGVFPWWPEDGNDWVHPQDIALARDMIPSQRVFCRDGTEDGYLLLYYGRTKLRVRRTLWQEVPGEEFRIGDWVEVLSRGMLNSPRTGMICEMLWDEADNAIRYQIEENGLQIDQRYTRDDLRHVDPTPTKGEMGYRDVPDDLGGDELTLDGTPED